MNWFTGRLPRRTGVAVPIVAFPAVHALIPWALSLLGTRHGWAGGRPGISNFVGLIPVAAGFCISFLCSREHFLAAPDGWLPNELRITRRRLICLRKVPIATVAIRSTWSNWRFGWAAWLSTGASFWLVCLQ